MPKRSHAQLAKDFGLAEQTVRITSSEWSWTDRVAAWDVELDRRVRETEVSVLRTMAANHINIATGLQKAAAEELKATLEKIDLAKKTAAVAEYVREPLLNPREIVALVEAGTKLERISRGEPGEIVNTTGNGATSASPAAASAKAAELARLDDQELEEFDRLVRKMRSDPEDGSEPKPEK